MINDKINIKQRYERAKEHVSDYKLVYSCAATGAVVASFTCLIMKGRYEALATGGAYGSKTADTSITMRPFSFLSKQKNVVKVIARDGRGHPGYIIHSLDTNEFFSSQREAASIFNISQTLLSKHLTGKIADAEGYRFERLNITV